MPHQVALLHVALEYREDRKPGENLYYYDAIDFTMMRQVGKTIIAFVDMCRVAHYFPGTNTGWTGQTGKDAAEKWTEELYPHIERQPIRRSIKPLNQGLAQGNGNEKIRWKNGSSSIILRGGHGRTLVRAYDDEIWKDTDNWRDSAIGPGMRTAVSQYGHRQRWKFSTNGDETSDMLAAIVASGYRAVEEDTGEGICFADWGAPDGMDVTDIDSHVYFNPSIGYTQDLGTLRADLRDARDTDDVAEFVRSAGNIRRGTTRTDIITPDEWSVPQNEAAEVATGELVLSLDVGRRWSVIAASDGRTISIIHCRTGTDWIPEVWNGLTAKYGPGWIDGRGPATGVSGLERVKTMTLDKVCIASDRFVRNVKDNAIAIRTSGPLTTAVDGASKRSNGETMWRWSRTGSDHCVAPLIAASIADYAHEIAPPKKKKRVAIPGGWTTEEAA